MNRFLLEKGPFVRSTDENINSTRKMMINLMIALIPVAIFAEILFGILPVSFGGYDIVYSSKFICLIRPIFNIVFCAFCSFTLELLFFFLFKKVRGFKNLLQASFDSFSLIPGIIIALMFPSTIPLHYLLFACVIANIIFKMLFGGLGHNIFNPALIGYAFTFFAFSSLEHNVDYYISLQGQMLNQVLSNIYGFTVTASSTPLASLKALAQTAGSFNVSYSSAVGNYGNLFYLFLGFKNGNMGEVSGLCCLIGFIWLLVKKVINWRVPVIYLGTVAIITFLIAVFCHIDGIMWFPIFNLVTGGLFFGSIFMATEPVTTPKNPNGKVIFAIGCGVLTVLFRLVGQFSEGVATSILFMCLFTPLIDKFAATTRIYTKKGIIKYACLGLLFALIVVYTIYKCANIQTDAALEIFEVI